MIPIYFSDPAVFCAIGSNKEEFWASLISGNQSGIKKVEALQYSFFAAKINDSLLTEKSSSKYDSRIIRIEEKCLSQIENEIQTVIKKYSPQKIGICVGSCDNGTELSVKGHTEFFKNQKFSENYNLEMQSADYVSTFIAEKYKITGPALSFSTACSSSASAIIKASELLQSEICDAVICGGVDLASNTALIGFNSLEAISSEITNPFSKNRHGITLGEGAAFFVLTREPLFTSENPIKLLGYGESADAYHMTSPDPEGKGAFLAMQRALKKSQKEPKDIDYLNLHGTGTKFNDSMEAKAVAKLFGENSVPSSSTKSLTGHTLGASGAIECAACYLTLKNNYKKEKISLPLQVWDGIKDEQCPSLNIVDKNFSYNKKEVNCCMSNSFAFGGANSSLVLGF